MKNILTNLMASAVLLFSVGGGLEAQSIQMHAVVPFTWEVNGHQLNQGDFNISRDAASPIIRIQDTTGKSNAYVMAAPGSTTGAVSQLVFHRYGDRYFLAAVVTPGSSFGRLPVSAAEKAVQSEQPQQMSLVFVDIKPLFN